ncbi:ATP-grasp domain-containing protein [Paenibacillus cremeus]|uniref:ATP-grasp domain-containing protein n=1 Tax=Paenibacillus cremeus TaxID=2163881 RepID=A0A559KIQ7_9BACL|nr:ATP-grasp domain-containing protein [Paenibacillus cremeus]TVY12025.1 ATP-grasp domain-containing protein [Paenibacillus cremeus]
MAKQVLRILLTGAGSPAASGFIRSLRLSQDLEFTVIGMDCNSDAVGFHMTDKHVVGPRASDAAFIPFVLNICAKEKVDLIFSLVTDELIKLSEAKEELLRAGTRILISSADSLRNVIHKGRLYQSLQTMGMSVPEFRIVNTPADLIHSLYDLGYPNHPVCFKPVISDGSRGFHILDKNVDRFQMLFREKPSSAHIGEEELIRILVGHVEIPETLVMEYLPYEEYSVDLLAADGKVVVAIPRLREATVGGITTKGLITREQDIIDYAVTVAEGLNLNGNIGVQIRRDRQRNPKIVEINPRIQGTIVHCTAAGINLPVLAVKQAFGIVPSKEELGVKWGTRMTRYWEEVFHDAHGSSYAL